MTLRSSRSCAALLAVLALTWSGVASARNPHCAGGIQYVVQGMRDKDKGNTEDYAREMNKAVAQLEQCVAEDPADIESFGYLGWAYAELDSAGPAGKAFETAIKGLCEKDKKKCEWATQNRNSYWARAFNDGIDKIRVAQQTYADYTKQPSEDAEKTLREEAGKNYQLALAALTRADLLRPGDSQTIRNRGSVYAFMGDQASAEQVFVAGLKTLPGDTSLAEALRAVRVNQAQTMIDAKQYDKAIAFFTDMIKSEPGNSNHYSTLADVYFKRAQSKEGDARKEDFRAAGEQYAKAADIKKEDVDLRFNAALAYQNAGVWDKAEANWRAVLQLKPDDTDAMSSLGATLAELKKFDEGALVLTKAVNLKPQNKILHRQLGAVYTKANNNPKATEELMVFLALDKGQAAADPAAAAKAARDGSAAAKTLASEGAPDEVRAWQADTEAYETWFYWKKHSAYTFKAGTLVQKSDWGAAEGKAGSGGAKK